MTYDKKHMAHRIMNSDERIVDRKNIGRNLEEKEIRVLLSHQIIQPNQPIFFPPIRI